MTAPLEPVDGRTLDNLGMDRVIHCIEERTSSPSGRRLARLVDPTLDSVGRARRRGLVSEMRVLVEGDESEGHAGVLDLSFLDDLRPLFSRLERGGVLEGEEVIVLSRLIPPSLSLRRAVLARERDMPALCSLLEQHGLGTDEAAGRLHRIDLEVAAVLEDDGSVKDSASPELRRLRRRARDLRARLSARARRLVERHADHLQDAFFTLRDDRYVLPVRSDARSHVRGIIHGSSNSGATLFVEPDVLVDECNELKVVEGQAQACERAVLVELSTELASRGDRLESIHAMLAEVDLLLAIVRFARDTSSCYPGMDDDPVLELRALRHPLLVLGGGDVVPNDVVLAAGRGWVLSGPNAGGKTVLIKAVGLTVLMSYAGLPVPVGNGSRVGLFDHVRAEIGDAQSVEGNLSTFSAQVSNLASILESAGPRSLLLLDELAAGTDPDEGAALAEAIVEEALGRGAAVIIATHFEPLKKLSLGSDLLVAAGMGLDLESLEPTFRLERGMPGTSGGLLVAERFGLPGQVVARARRLLEEGSGPEGGRLQVLERLRSELERKLRQARELEEGLRSRQTRLESRERELAREQRGRMEAEERYLTRELVVLRSELKQAHKVLRRRPVRESDVKRSERVASRVGRVLAPDGDVAGLVRPRADPGPPPDRPPARGDRVHVPRLDLTGEVEGVLDGKIRIRKGSVAWTVDLADVSRAAPGNGQTQGERAMDESRKPDPPDEGEDESVQTAYNTLDLRGQGLDEAQIDLDAFIDQALEMGIEEVFVIHGHGKGVLKTGLRRYLRHLKKVESFRPGQRGEGGDGVTVCRLRPE